MKLKICCLILIMLGLGPAQVLAQDETPRPALIMTVTSGEVGVTRKFFGRVVARQTVDLAFQVAGKIVSFPAQEGEVISAGGLISQLDLEPFELQLEQAQLQLTQAERTYNRLQQLTLSVPEARRDEAETQFGLAKVAARNAQVALNNATLYAPFDALVARRSIANFSTIAAGAPVVRIHDMSELRIEIDVPEILFQQAGTNANVRLLAKFPVSDKMYPLEVREFNAEASEVGQSFRITLALEPIGGLNVFPGSSVEVFATLISGEAPMLIPITALRLGNDGGTNVLRFISVSDSLGTVEEVPVVIEPTRDGMVRVLEGLNSGDEIVRTGAHAIEDGQTVRRFEGFAN